MKTHFFFGILFIFHSYLSAATLDCRSFVNLDEVTRSNVVTTLKQQVLIGKVPEVISYVTETKPNVFLLEAYLPLLDQRSYSEASLNSINDIIKSTTWSREILVDISCKRLN